jgi:hypothetical protein
MKKYYLFIWWPFGWINTRRGSSEVYIKDRSGYEFSLSVLVPLEGLSKTAPCTELITHTYYECVKYQLGHLEEALEDFYQHEGVRLVEVPEDQRPKPEALQPFASQLWDKKATVKDIRVFVAEDVTYLTGPFQHGDGKPSLNA